MTVQTHGTTNTTAAAAVSVATATVVAIAGVGAAAVGASGEALAASPSHCALRLTVQTRPTYSGVNVHQRLSPCGQEAVVSCAEVLLTYLRTNLPTHLLTYLLTLPCEQVLNQTSSEAHKFKLTALFLNRESDKAFFGG